MGTVAGVLLLFSLGACRGEHREILVVYSPHGPEMLGDYEKAFEEKYPGVDVQMLDMGTQTLFSRIQAERRRPVADVWWGGTSSIFAMAQKQGLLASYTPSWAGAVPPALKGENDTWYPTYQTPLAILYNRNGYAPEELPKTWDQLLDDKWKGRIVIRRPLESGTMRVFLCAMIARAADVDEGIAWLKRLHAATAAYPESPYVLFDHLRKNPDRITVWLLSDILLQRDRNGYPFAYVVPQDTPVLVDGIAIVNNAPHREWAERFYEFVTSTQAAEHQAHAYAKIPIRSDVPRDALPEELRPFLGLTPPPYMNRLADVEAAWCERWEREVFAGSPRP